MGMGAYLPVVLIAWVVPYAFPTVEVEVVDVPCGGLAGFPPLWKRCLEALSCDPEQLLWIGIPSAIATGVLHVPVCICRLGLPTGSFRALTGHTGGTYPFVLHINAQPCSVLQNFCIMTGKLSVKHGQGKRDTFKEMSLTLLRGLVVLIYLLL